MTKKTISKRKIKSILYDFYGIGEEKNNTNLSRLNISYISLIKERNTTILNRDKDPPDKGKPINLGKKGIITKLTLKKRLKFTHDSNKAQISVKEYISDIPISFF